MLDGIVKIVDYTPEGKEIAVALLGRDEVLGDISALVGTPHSLTAEAYTDVRVLQVSKGNLERALDAERGLWELLAKNALLRLYNLTEKYLEVIRDDVATRLENLLRSLETLDLELTHAELAALLGVSRETVTRVMRRLRDRSR